MSMIGIPGMFMSLIFFLVPIVIAVFLIIWIYHIKMNTEEQVRQNKRIIELLEKLNQPNP